MSIYFFPEGSGLVLGDIGRGSWTGWGGDLIWRGSRRDKNTFRPLLVGGCWVFRCPVSTAAGASRLACDHLRFRVVVSGCTLSFAGFSLSL